jgi:hypothetical protein
MQVPGADTERSQHCEEHLIDGISKQGVDVVVTQVTLHPEWVRRRHLFKSSPVRTGEKRIPSSAIQALLTPDDNTHERYGLTRAREIAPFHPPTLPMLLLSSLSYLSREPLV